MGLSIVRRGVCLCLTAFFLVMVPGQVSAYHEFDPPIGTAPKVVWEDPSPSALQRGYDPQVAVADYAGVRFVYVVWWRDMDGTYWVFHFRRLASTGGEGEGTWTETMIILDGPWVFETNSPPARDVSIGAYANLVYVAWTRPDGSPQGSKVHVAKSTDNGMTFAHSIPSDEGSEYKYFEPELVVTDTAVHLARVRYSTATPKRVQLVRLSPLPEILMHVTTDVEMTKGAEWPAVVSLGSSVLIALQRCTDCADLTTVQVHSASCTNDLMACTPLALVSAGAPSPSGAPVLASFGRHVHIAWQANLDVVYQRLQAGPLLTWDPVTRFTVGQTYGSPDRQSKYSIAAYGYAVAVAYQPSTVDPPRLRRNTYNGQPDRWQAPETVDCSYCTSGGVDLAVDARYELSGEKGNILQYVWARKENGSWRSIAHRRIPTEERERERTRFTDFVVAQGQVALSTDALVWILGGNVPTLSDRIWSYDPFRENVPPSDTGHRLFRPLAFASAVRVGTKGIVFYGQTSPPGLACIQIYDGTGDAQCAALSQPRDLYGTSAVYDGSRYAYVFGGRDSAGNYLNDVYKWDVVLQQDGNWGTCIEPSLPEGVAFTAAAWQPSVGVAYIFGGERQGIPPTFSPRNSYDVYRFDPADPTCPSVQLVATIPCPPWDGCGPDEQLSMRPGPGLVSVFIGGETILILGGRHLYDPILGGTFVDSRYIYSFSTNTHEFGLQFLDLPACKSFGAGVWNVPPGGSGRLYYFGGYKDPSSPTGCEGGGDQVVRYDRSEH